MFIADNHFRIEITRYLPDPVGTTHVRGRKGKVFHLKLLDVRDKYGRAVEMVHRNVEITLYLGGVEVHGDHAVCTCGNEHVGHEFGANGDPWFVFAVLPGIAIVRDHGHHLVSACPFRCVDHQQQFHDIFGWRESALDQEYHVAA